jgi:hypothetical protein
VGRCALRGAVVPLWRVNKVKVCGLVVRAQAARAAATPQPTSCLGGRLGLGPLDVDARVVGALVVVVSAEVLPV